MNHYVKYPRTYHLPWSQGATDDDKTLSIEELLSSPLAADEIIVTEKMDGENFTGYRNHCHARSLDSRHHPSRDWVKTYWAQVQHEIPEGWRVCGENLYARHSIEYEDLRTYLYVFNIWDQDNVCLSWDSTVEWCDLLGLVHVPVLYRGPFDLNLLQELAEDLDLDRQEGYVVRNTTAFSYDDFRSHCAKFVREGHVQTDEHWMHAEIVPNGLSED